MKSHVRWHARAVPHNWEFQGVTEAGLVTELAGRSVEGGPKEAPSPKELVAFGQSGCTGIDVVSFLQKMREPLESLEITSDVIQTTEEPRVFASCEILYDVKGAGLRPARVARAVELSLLKHCGVSAMIERSGCEVLPRLRVNGLEVSIWNPEQARSRELKEWYESQKAHCPRGAAVVVGASRGIGRSLVRRLSGMGFAVITGSRGMISGDRAPTEADPLYLDVRSALSREAFCEVLRHSGIPIKTLVLNAGILDHDALTASQVREPELRRVFDTNLFAPIEMSHILIPLLTREPTVLFVSSYMGLPMSEEYNFSSYRLSKCALTLFARELGRELRSQGVAVAALHPGSVRTEMNPSGAISPDESAERVALLLAEGMYPELLQRNGDFWMVSNKETKIRPWDVSQAR